MHCWSLSFACGLLLCLQACAPGAQEVLSQAGTAPPTPQTLVDLGAPSRLAAQVPPQNPLIYIPGRFMHAAYALQQYPGQRVTVEEHLLRFDPDWPAGGSAGLDRLAYAVYCFDMTYFEGEGTFTLGWQGQAPSAENVFLGLGHIAEDSWVWFTFPAEGPLELEDLSPYISEDPYLLLAVALLGDQPAVLSWVQIGDRWYVEGVDLSMLCAPVLDFEVQALRNDWAARSPVEQGYTYVGDEVGFDGLTYAVVSHTVDGLTHYGAVRIPPHDEGQKLPVLLLCHPGVGGTRLREGDWLDNLIDDETLSQSLLVVIPSFRSEPLSGGSVGQFVSDGPPSIWDRDADDAIALLDCVLNNFPEAETQTVIAVGYSRGAQVAQRVAERDPRIDGVVEIAGMTDEWTLDGQYYIYSALPDLGSEPDPADFYHHTLWRLREGLCDVWTMRAAMLKTSTSYFAGDLPAIQIHHGAEDSAVSIKQAERLRDMLEATPGAQYEYYRYEDGVHAVSSLTGAGERIRQFLESYVQ